MPSELNVFLVERTCELVAAYVRRNSVPLTDLSALIASVHRAIVDLGRPPTASPVVRSLPTSLEIAASIGPDHIISFLDGKPYKVLSRHLRFNGLTPERYRSLYALPVDYPMVATSYAACRSQIAKRNGLGRKAS